MFTKACNILVTGGDGQIGRELVYLGDRYSDLNVEAHDRDVLDITSETSIRRMFAGKNWDYCLNCAAYTAVDRAESEPDQARSVNRDGARNLARACREHGVRLLHFSTDYVYHNNQNRPLLEGDATHPQSVYARTKLAGEEDILAALPTALILRTSWVYSSYGHNFVKTMLRLGRERESLRIVYDQVGAPTYARDIARACLEIIRQTQAEARSWQGGIFNYSNEGVCSWYDFALAIFELSDMDCEVLPIETRDFPTPAQRPSYSLLNKTKFKSVFQMTIPHWREALERCLLALR